MMGSQTETPQKTTLQQFESVFPKLEEALIEHANSYKLPQSYVEWYKKVRRAVQVPSASRLRH